MSDLQHALGVTCKADGMVVVILLMIVVMAERKKMKIQKTEQVMRIIRTKMNCKKKESIL
jgi:Gpi18-like mannosyltransferase